MLTAAVNYSGWMSRPGEIVYVMNAECAAYMSFNAKKRCEIFMMITVRRQVGEALVLAPLPLAVADVEVNLHRAGYSLVPVRRDLHNNSTLKHK